MSKVVPATRGQSEGTGESGYAFNLKKIQADKALYTVHFMLRQFWNQVYEGYLIQAGRQYSIEGIERKFISKGGKFTAIFNEKTTLPDGSIAIKNDASKLLEIRHKVIISEIQDTPTKKMEDISLLNSYLQSMGQFASSLPATSIFILTKIPTLIDSLSEEDRETLTAIGEKELIGALLEVEIKNISLSKQLDQLTNPPPPAPAPAAPGMPVPPQAALPAPGGEQIQPLPQPEPQAQGGVNG
jgi:hypothetical protein